METRGAREPSPAGGRRTTKHSTATSAADDAALDPNSSYAKAYALIPAGSRVLDVGCGSGELASYLSARGDRVWGVDTNAAAIARAAAFCVDTRVADVEQTELSALFAGLQFDIVLFAGVLEHLREPWKVLQAARDVLAPDGRVVASIPNFGHAAVRLAVVSGALPYRGLGIVDDPHVRFFTLSGVESLFEESGFRLEAITRTSLAFGAPSQLVPDVGLLRIPDEIDRHVRADPEHETLQFIVRAVMHAGAWDMDSLRGRLHDVEARLVQQTAGLRNLELEHVRTRASAAELEARAAALEPLVDELRATLAAKTAEHDAYLTAATADRQAMDEQLRSAKAALAEALASRDRTRAELADAQTRLRHAEEVGAHRLDVARREGVALQRALMLAEARNRAAGERHAAERAQREALERQLEHAREEFERELEQARDEFERELEQVRDELERANAAREESQTRFDAQLQSARAEARECAHAVSEAERQLARCEADAARLRAALSGATSEVAEVRARDRRAGLTWLATEHEALAELDDGAQFWRADGATR